MKKTIIYTVILNIFCFFFGCKEKEEEQYSDSSANEFMQKGNELFILPAESEKGGNTYKIFIYNETEQEIDISEGISIKPDMYILVNLVDHSALRLDIGVKFLFSETNGLEVEDKKSQVSGLGGEYLDQYKVPDEAEWAFVIVPEGEGD